ncbi:hypothetical protein TWF281_002463 [Arthrobotrys megalospora]
MSNGRLFHIAEDTENEERIYIGRRDLLTSSTRTCIAHALNLDRDGLTSTLAQDGGDAFTNEAKDRASSILRLPESPEFFCASGRFAAYSASFLTHYTIWNFGSSVAEPENPITGKSISLDPQWVDYAFERLEVDPDFAGNQGIYLSYYMSIDGQGDIYTTINGHISERGCRYNDDRIFCRYACRSDGTPIPMHTHGWIPPNIFPDCHDNNDTIYVAGGLTSFQSAGKNFLAISPPEYLEEYNDQEDGTGLEYNHELELYYPRITVDRKRYEKEQSLPHVESEALPESRHKRSFEYKLGYLNWECFWIPPPGEIRSYGALPNKIIPTPSKNCVVWECRYKDENMTIEGAGGGSVKARRIKVIGLKPTTRPKREDSDEECFDPEIAVHVPPVGGSLDSIIPDLASICEFTVDNQGNNGIQWAGDDQNIVVSHCRPMDLGNQEEGTQYESVFRIFRYGIPSEEPVSYAVRYTEF